MCEVVTLPPVFFMAAICYKNELLQGLPAPPLWKTFRSPLLQSLHSTQRNRKNVLLTSGQYYVTWALMQHCTYHEAFQASCQTVSGASLKSALISWASWGTETALPSSPHSLSLSAPYPDLPYPLLSQKCLLQPKWNKPEKSYRAWEWHLRRTNEGPLAGTSNLYIVLYAMMSHEKIVFKKMIPIGY